MKVRANINEFHPKDDISMKTNAKKHLKISTKYIFYDGL